MYTCVCVWVYIYGGGGAQREGERERNLFKELTHGTMEVNKSEIHRQASGLEMQGRDNVGA